jgi:gliding motility-associated-like protein
MFARKIFIATIILLITQFRGLHGQSAYVNTALGLFQLNGNPANAERVFIPNSCGNDNGMLSIAVYKDTVYYNTWMGELKRFKIGVPGSCETLLTDHALYNAMTVDKNGIIYMASSELVRYDPHTRQLTDLGLMPFNSMGDLVFYKDKLLLAGWDTDDWSTGIYEIDIDNPGNSKLYMETPPFIGLLSYPVICGGSRYFGLMADNMGTTKLIELDMPNKTVIGPTCSIPMDILDGASGTESGWDNKVAIRSLAIHNSCQSSTGSVQMTADYPGTGTISYTLDNGTTNTTGLFSNLASGEHHLKALTTGGSCFADTTFTIEAGYTLVTGVTKSNPDKCANVDGRISIHASLANGAVSYTLLNTGVSQSSGDFTGLRGGLYRFRISNTSGCSVDTSVALAEMIPVGGCSDMYIPNAFTPNYDGRNDQFTISLSSAFRDVTLQVFNRWGNIVCQARGNNISWDGNYKGVPQPVGVYVYTLMFTDPNGMQKNVKGSLSLLR